MVDANVAVLIDYENVGLDAIQHLLDQLSDVGRVIIRRAYGDWSVQRGKQDQLLELGIEPIHQYHSNKSGKNSSDIRLAIEAIDLLHNSPIDTFVIVSSDSDFVPLVGKLRSSGKSVIVAGRREATSPTLIKSCDRYIFLDAEKRVVSPQSAQPRRRTGRRGGPQEARMAMNETNSRSLLLRAMDASMDEAGEVVGSKLYQTMRRIEPSFNFKDLKHRLFTQFLDAHTDVIDVMRPKDGTGDVIVQLSSSREQARPAAASNGRAARSSDARSSDARVSDASDEEKAAPTQRNTDAKPKAGPGRGQPNRRQSEPRGQSGRRLLGSTRPSDDKPEPESAPVPVPVEVPAPSDEPKQVEVEASAPAPKPQESAADTNGASVGISWERAVDAAWAKRDVDRIAGRSAASDAAKVLGAPKLGASQYPTLEKLLSASTLLQLNWRREGNAIFRK